MSTDLDDVGKLPPAKQSRVVRSRWIRPVVLGLEAAGVRRWVLINALQAELVDLVEREYESRQQGKTKL